MKENFILLEDEPGHGLEQRRGRQGAGVGEEGLVGGQQLGGVDGAVDHADGHVLDGDGRQMFADLLNLRVAGAGLDEHPEDSQSVRLVHGHGRVAVLAVVVDNVQLSVVLHPVQGVLAASSSSRPPVGVHLEDLEQEV